MWENSNGFMIADGTVWWGAIIPAAPPGSAPPDITPGKYPFKVITVNNGNGGKLEYPAGESK